jgi:riboflavin kinase / FMN adenylyltransferase
LISHIFPDIDPKHFKNSVVTVGIFDGVHRGHLSILTKLKEKAASISGETVVITLWPHPRMVLYPGKEIKLLSTLEEKQILLEQFGIDHFVIIPFNEYFAQKPASNFIKEILVDKIGLKCLLLGFDNHFGYKKEGNFDIIKEDSEVLGFELIHLLPLFDGRDTISSTDIRLYLELGEIEKANKLLGYSYSITGKVIRGRMLGRTIGFPTANIVVSEYKMIPRVGVYAVMVSVNGNVYNGMLNIGFRPTVEKILLHKTIEAHLIDFNGDLYDKEITITFAARLRDEQKFENIDVLKLQLEKDKNRTIEIFDKQLINKKNEPKSRL